jgi:hypothetical protein
MTVTVTDVLAGPFTPNGATVSFPFDFKVPSASEVRVYRLVGGVETDIVSGFTVTLAEDGEGGAVVFSTAPATGSGSIFIEPAPSFEQNATFSNSGFLPSTLNPVLDRIAIGLLALRELTRRSVKFPAGSDPLLIGDLSGASAGDALGFDEDGVLVPVPITTLQEFEAAFAEALLTSGALAGGPCATAATSNVSLSGIQTIGGVAGAADMRVLLTAQTAPAQNGPWVMKSGSWVRPADFDSDAEARQGAFVLVTGGTNRGGYVLTTPAPVTLGTTALNWVLVVSYVGGEVNFGSGGIFDIPSVDGTGNWSRIMFIQPAPALGTQTNSAGGNDAVSVSLAIASGRVTNGPTGHPNYWDTVMNFGLNQTGAFTPLNTDMPSASYRIESKFAQGGPSDPFMVEFHSSMFPASDPTQEYRLFSGTIPHLISNWNGAGADYSMRANLYRFMSGVGDDRIAIFFGALGNSMEFKDNGAGKPHPQLIFGTNNRAVAVQRNAAADALLPLPYINAQNNVQIPASGLYINGSAAATPSGSGNVGIDLNITGGGVANMRAINAQLPSVTGDAYAAFFNATGVSGKVFFHMLSTTGIPALNLQVGTGSTNDAGVFFTNQGGGTSWVIGYDNSDGDKLKFESNYQSVGGSNVYFELDAGIGATRFAKPPKLPSYTVAGLPAAATVGAGAKAYVTDLNATTAASVAAGGGSNKGEVICDGTNWRIVAAWA